MSKIEQAILIKPLSVNQCWQGRRFKTKKYSSYEREMLFKLKKFPIPSPPLRLWITVGFSNKCSDLDNILKPFLDILQKKYGFNDKDVHEIILHKRVAKKGADWIEFILQTIEK